MGRAVPGALVERFASDKGFGRKRERSRKTRNLAQAKKTLGRHQRYATEDSKTDTEQEDEMATQLTSTGTQEHEVVSPKEWIASRKELLQKEKEFNKQRDELSRQRRELPWERVEKQYVFDGPNGKETLADLFDRRSQLIVYHFMFGPGWAEGCPSCSFLPIISTAAWFTSRIATPRWSWFRARPRTRSKRSKNAWDGASSGCRLSRTTLTATTTCRSRKRKWPKVRCPTTTMWSSSRARRGPAQASSIRTLAGTSSTLIPLMRAGSTSYLAPTTSSTSRRKVATRMA